MYVYQIFSDLWILNLDYLSQDLRIYDFGTTSMTDVLTTGNLLLSSTHLCFIIFSYTEALIELFPFRPVSVHS